MKSLKTAIIGIGAIGWKYTVSGKQVSHVSSYLACPKTELVAVADVDRVKLEDFKIDHPDISVYTDYEKMLNEAKPEILSVAVPTSEHCRVVRNSCRFHNLAVIFVEKPISSTVKEAEKMTRACNQFQVKLACNHTRRWDNAYRRVKRIVDGEDGAYSIGDLIAFDGRFSRDPIGAGSHMADLFNFYRQDNTKVNLLHISVPHVIFELDLFGSGGAVRVLRNGEEIQIQFAEESQYKGFRKLGDTVVLEETYDFPDAMLNAIDDLAECATTEKRPDCDGNDGLNALKLCLEMGMGAVP